MTTPYSFDEFFASNQEESISPFLKSDSRKWGKNLTLKASVVAAVFLLIAYLLSSIHPITSHFFLSWVYFLVGTPALINTLKDLSKLDINIDVLMTLAALLSVIIGSGLEGALLLVLFELSAGMEMMVDEKTRSSVLHLNRLSPKFACVIEENGHLTERPLRDVEIESLILVRAGETVPLDGVVVEGRSYVNLVHLTGESAPIPKEKGDEVPSGAGNLDGSLTIRVTRNSRDSTLSRIIKLVTQAQESKPKIQQLFDRFDRIYASSIIVLAALFALILPWFLSIPYLGVEGSVYRALGFLIAASPCALILATPTAYLSAISSCVKKGILPKGGIALDAVYQCKQIAMDKTGTLTTGELVCLNQTYLYGPPLSVEEALGLAASLERNAVHPIAKALVAKAYDMNITLKHMDDFKSISGFGLQGKCEGKQIAIGHRDFIQEKIGSQFQIPAIQTITTYLWAEGTVFSFEFEDTIRTTAPSSIKALRKEGIEVVMLTGDHAANAAPIAKKLGIDYVFSDLRPEDKLEKVRELAQTSHLMMVGDGINDAPALARATVGVSMGKIGSAAAVDASDIILIHDDLSLIPWLIQKAKQTRNILIQNISLALIVILFATTPALLGFIPLWGAVVLHEGGTLIVGLNSLRLLYRKS